MASFNFESTTKGSPTMTALELYYEEILSGCILSYWENLDFVLKCVLVPKTITEFSGESGCGKTQVCFQICITVQLPKWCGGFGGEALYVNANNNFSSSRIRELARNFIDQYKTFKMKTVPPPNDFIEESILKNIHYIRVKNGIELIAFVEALENYVKEKNIKLLVIDSISYPIRCLDVKIRKNILGKIFCDLRSLAKTYNFTIVITNDLTTRVNEGESYVTPSFGDSFYHLVNNRFIFSKKNSAFHIKLVKSVLQDKKESLFYIRH